jgi:hypothetical protein
VHGTPRARASAGAGDLFNAVDPVLEDLKLRMRPLFPDTEEVVPPLRVEDPERMLVPCG